MISTLYILQYIYIYKEQKVAEQNNKDNYYNHRLGHNTTEQTSENIFAGDL